MRLLVDTHLLLCAAAKSRRLPAAARALLEDPANEVFFSAASLWEVVIKASLRRADFNVDVAALRPSGAHAERLAGFPPRHKDPFDRMLVAQSLAEPLLLLTNDAVLGQYGDTVRVV